MSKPSVKVAVTGAAGQIGYALLFRIASGQMLGPDTPIELQLLELERGLPALEGVAMELEDCAFPLLRKIMCTSDVNKAMEGANWAILVGSRPRAAGMERSDLLQANGAIFTEQGQAMNNSAADDVRIFVVGNPCNTNALIAMHNAPDIPNNRFFAMTRLDELRGKAQLAQRAGVPVKAVTQMTIWGNHSSTQYPDFYNAKVNGQPVIEIITDEQWLRGDFIKTVQQRGAAIIKARGASSAASAANAVVTSIHHLTHDTPDNDTFSVASYATGQYGVDDLVFSFPSRTRKGQFEVIENVQHNAFGQQMFDKTLRELLDEYEIIKNLGLIKVNT